MSRELNAVEHQQAEDETHFVDEWLEILRATLKLTQPTIDEAEKRLRNKESDVQADARISFVNFALEVIAPSFLTIESQKLFLESESKVSSMFPDELIDESVREVLHLHMRRMLEAVSKVIILTSEDDPNLYHAYISDQLFTGMNEYKKYTHEAFGLSNRSHHNKPKFRASIREIEANLNTRQKTVEVLNKRQLKLFNILVGAERGTPNISHCCREAFEFANPQEKALLMMFPEYSLTNQYLHFNFKRVVLSRKSKPLVNTVLYIGIGLISVLIRLVSILKLEPTPYLAEKFEKFIHTDPPSVKAYTRQFKEGEMVKVHLGSGIYKAAVLGTDVKIPPLVIVQVDYGAQFIPEYKGDTDRTDWIPAIFVEPMDRQGD